MYTGYVLFLLNLQFCDSDRSLFAYSGSCWNSAGITIG